MTPEQNGRLVVYRPESYMDNEFPYTIFANGKRLGTLESGSQREFTLPEGSYDIKIKQAWWWGKLREVNIKADERTTIACPHRMRHFGLILNVFIMIIAPMYYLKIRVIKG